MSFDIQKKQAPKPRTIFIIAWIGLFIFNLLFARLTTTVPVSLISIFMLFTAGALYKERPHLRPMAIVALIIALIFLAITYFGTIWLRYEVVSLLDIRGPKLFQVSFYLFSFLNAAAFTTVGIGLFKGYSRNKTGFITLIVTAWIYFGIAFLLKDFIQTLLEITAQMPQG